MIKYRKKIITFYIINYYFRGFDALQIAEQLGNWFGVDCYGSETHNSPTNLKHLNFNDGL